MRGAKQRRRAARSAAFILPVPLTHATPELTFIQVGGRKISTCEVSDEATEPDPGIIAAAAERVRAWSTTADADRPWLVYAGLRRPHLPCNAPAAHFARYPVAGVELATPAERAWVVGGLDWDSSGELHCGMVRQALEPWQRQSWPPRLEAPWRGRAQSSAGASLRQGKEHAGFAA